MKRLKELIQEIPIRQITGTLPETIGGLKDNSREVEPGDLFVAVRGERVDGHRFVADAVKRGASVVVVEKPVPEMGDLPQIVVENSREALAGLAARYYDFPSQHLALVGVTGTNGKTTVATLLYQLYKNLGYPAGLISTIDIRIDDEILPTKNTTPGLLELQKLLARMRDAGIQHVFMEVSSHGIAQGRIQGLTFSGGIFTNLSRDHLDYHGDMAAYRDTKKRFFDMLRPDAFALTNADDKNGPFMVQNTLARVKTYGILRPADFKAAVLEEGLDGMLLEINGRQFYTPMIGLFNAYNLTAVYGAAVSAGEDPEEVLVKLSGLKGAPGRIERIVSPDGKVGVVDYAHTPDALDNVLRTLRKSAGPGSRIITVVGAGGDRDKGKRPLMGKIAARGSDWLILTSDNPRTEDPQQILDQMQEGIPQEWQYKTLSIPDREQAIKAAVMYARPGDVILVAGKGHEDYQIIGTEKLPFSDREVLMKYLSNKPKN